MACGYNGDAVSKNGVHVGIEDTGGWAIGTAATAESTVRAAYHRQFESGHVAQTVYREHSHMENLPKPKATLIIKVMEHGTITGTDDPVCLEFEDCVNAVGGLVGWLAETLAEVHDAPEEEIGSAILIDALHRWTFDEQMDEGMGLEGDGLGDFPEEPPAAFN